MILNKDSIPPLRVFRPTQIFPMQTIQISKPDFQKLQQLIELEGRSFPRLPEHLVALNNEIQRAELKDSRDMANDVITLHRTARLTDLDTGEHVEYTLVYPDEADIERGRISILAPLGTAMLGFRKGDSFQWEVPAGMCRWRIDDVFGILPSPVD